MTKQLELKRISISEVDTRLSEYALNFSAEDMGQIAHIMDAQLQADQQVLDNAKQAIFDEIDGKLKWDISCPDYHWWQALKKKWLK